MNQEPIVDSNDLLPTPTKPRRRWLTALLGVLIFGGGFACGAGVTIVVAVHRLQYAIQHPEEAPTRVANTLQRRLGLDNTQKAKVEAIMAKHQVELAAVRQEFQPRVVEQLEQIRDEIGQVLDESQRERWTKMFDDLRDRWLPPTPPGATGSASALPVKPL